MVGFFYGQTEYSILDNAIHMNDYVGFAVSEGYPFLTMTDDNLGGFFKFYNLCKKNNIKPVIGLKIKLESKINRNSYVLAYALNKKGFSNLCMISTEQLTNKVVSDDFIRNCNSGLVFVSAGADCDLDFYFYEKNKEEFLKELDRLKSFGNLYIGIQPRSFIGQTISEEMLTYAKKTGLVCLPLAKSCYLKNEEKVYRALKLIDGKKYNLGEEDSHLLSKKELLSCFEGMDDLFKNTKDLILKIDDNLFETSRRLPVYPNKYNMDSKDYLEGLAYKGLEKRLQQIKGNKQEYKERLAYELSVIDKMGYSDYFLIVWDYVRYAKTNGIFVGPGRGSCCGSLVAYSLGITDINPLEYGLLFERFLNPERVSMPDIDMDFPDDKREEVIKYVSQKYGVDHVSYITAFSTFKLKSSIRDVINLYGIDNQYQKNIVKFLENEPSVEEIKKEYASHKDICEAVLVAKKLEDLPRNISSHAAGIILSGESMMSSIPLREGANGLYQSQVEAHDMEALGFLKMDFLGIRNLQIIDNTVLEINKKTKFDIKRIPLNDKLTFDMLSKGDTLGIFQLESAGITRVCKKMKLNEFKDMVAILALYRPGPMDNIDEFIERKNGKAFEYPAEELKPILAETYGIIVYQEQIMKIAQVFAGYSLGEADVLRRAVSKKQHDVLVSEGDKFISRSKKLGKDEKTAKLIYDYIVKFADYGFNKSHAVAYGLFSYQMAYLKANYPKEFICQILSNVIGGKDETRLYCEYAKKRGINILAPMINYSTDKYQIGSKGLLMPLNSVLGISNTLVNKIVLERENGLFKNFVDVKKRLSGVVNSNVLTNLINAGAFDEFKITHYYMTNHLETDSFDLILALNDEIHISDEEFSLSILRDFEYQALGFNIKYNIFNNYEAILRKEKAIIPSQNKSKNFKFIGIVSKVKTIKTKQNKEMAFVRINCNSEYTEITLFPDEYTKYKELIESKDLLAFIGQTRSKDEDVDYIVNEITII